MALGATLAWLLAIGASGFGQQRWIIKNGYLKYKQSPQYCASLREGKVSNGVDIILWHCTKDAEHKFKVNGAYIQYEADPSYCVSVREGRAGDGSDIILWKCNDSPAFHWEVDGEFIKYKAKPSYVMSVRQDNPMDGADLILWRGAGMNDKWTFDGKLVRMDSDRSKCLSVSGKAGEGSNVVSASCGTGEPPVRWIREGKFIKWESNPRYCLSIRRGHIMDGEDVILWNCMDSPEFYWEVSGSYIQHAANQAYCLSVRETSGRKAVATAMIWSCQATEPLGLPVSADQRQQSMASENIWIMEGPYIKSSLDSKYCASVRKGEVTNGAADFNRQSGIDDFTFPALFARRAKAYLTKYPDVKMADLAAVGIKAYSNGNKNPLAHMHAIQLPPEKAVAGKEFLQNEELKPFVQHTHCSQVSDGGAAAIFMSEEGLKKYGLNHQSAVEIVASDYGVGDLWSDPLDLTVMDTTKTVVSRMLATAGVRPGDLDVAEVHDCFAIAEILMYEAIGLAEPGKGTELVKSGATSLEGRIPVNTGGGLISFGHPVGATGVKQVLEVYRQMKGLCGDYQMPRTPQLGLAVNMGGDDRTSAAMLLRNTSPASKL